MKRVSLSLAVWVALGLGAQAGAEESPVEATGEAALVDGNRALAKDRALEDALRKAVEQVCGTMVSAESRTENFRLVSDKILTQAKGYVSSYEVLGQKAEGGVLSVTIRAKVGTDKLASDLEAIGLTLARKGMPRMAVLIAEQRIDELKPASWWGQQGDAKAPAAGALRVDQRISENALISEWTKAGFTFVDMDALAGKVRSAGIVTAELSKDQVRELANLSEADVVLLGSAVSIKQQDQSKVLEGVSQGAESVTGVTCSATVTLRALNSDNADILASGEATSPAFNQSALSCGRDAMVKAAREVSAQLQKDLLAAWNKQLGGAARVRVRLSGVDSLKALNAFKSLLGSAVRGVTRVDQKSFKNGTADLDVRIQGSSDAFASELETKKVGKRSLSVTGMTANVIEVQLAR